MDNSACDGRPILIRRVPLVVTMGGTGAMLKKKVVTTLSVMLKKMVTGMVLEHPLHSRRQYEYCREVCRFCLESASQVLSVSAQKGAKHVISYLARRALRSDFGAVVAFG